VIEEVEPVVDSFFCDFLDSHPTDRFEAFTGTGETLRRFGEIAYSLVAVRPIVLGSGVGNEGITERAQIFGGDRGLALETN
jgi:hypothetical protein